MHSQAITMAGRRAPRGLFAAAALSLAATFTALQPAPAAAQAQPQPQLRAMPDFADLAELVGPSVVNIRTTEKAKNQGRGGAQVDPNLEEFFRRFGIPLPNGRNPRGNNDDDDQPQRRGVGSGFILSADGFVMTNAHVVDGADELIVTLTDKREFKAKVIGADTRTDVAVVKIEATGLPAVKIGDVNKLRVGEWVMAIGSPFNLENTVTAGIVSAKQRDTGDYVPLLQTDVAVNPGNSGGPLLNLRGEVVGINSQIYSPSGAYAGISFAIPIDEAIRVSDQLRAGGRVVRGRIGVRIAPVTKEVAESIGLGKPVGALVQGVEPGTPAEKAGIEAGDIIVKVDGRQVDKSVDLQRMIGGIKPGTKATLQVFRRGSHKDISLTVAELEADSAKPRAPTPAESQSSSAAKAHLGLTVIELTDAQKKELKVRGGVRVETSDGAAARAGIREGDVILSIDNTEVVDVKQFGNVVGKLDKNKPVTLLVRRGEWVNYIVIRPAR
ncbi:MAG TPA: DegQ family serine endoprotease [Ideonella sp.]|jgi:serine protease Do|uniref:DegQ family serine endoprotease n=1 Tax=Ideonella sp. TaxID=1929293 RepID=UPI002E2FC123|nr:DegQ family serine endoprotease [Ideonella sp.]HEX5686758.1 DegQ family serine endoprotease [Ideonella sp.]